MGSLLSGVLTCFFREFLESNPYEYILPNNIHNFRYIDDILMIYPNKTTFLQLYGELAKKNQA